MCFQKFQMLFLMHKMPHLWEPLKVVFCILQTRPHQCLISSLFSGTSCPILYISCLNPGTDHFFKEPQFPWWLRSDFATSTPFTQPVNVTKDSIFLNPMVISQFSSDLIYLWLLTWAVTPPSENAFSLGFQEQYALLTFFSLLCGPLFSPLCWFFFVSPTSQYWLPQCSVFEPFFVFTYTDFL